jgi:hypothetical protein
MVTGTSILTFSESASERPTWMTAIIFLDPNYKVTDPIQNKPTNQPSSRVGQQIEELQVSQVEGW